MNGATFTRDQFKRFDWSECKACGDTVVFAVNRQERVYVLVPVPDGGGTGPTLFQYHQCPHREAA